MGHFLTPESIRWSLIQLAGLPKNQTALLYFLIFAKVPRIDRAALGKGSPFEKEFYRYFGGPIRGGGLAVFDPFGGEWRAEDYINSTVYGRLLNGSHRWTVGEGAFFLRTPTDGWPAGFALYDGGFDNLKYRSTSPCLKHAHRIPIVAMAIYYYRFLDLWQKKPLDEKGLIGLFIEEVVSLHPRLKELFTHGHTVPVTLFRSSPLTELDMLGCFPPSPAASDSKKNELLYEEDLILLKKHQQPGETTADVVHRLLKGIRA